MSGSAKRGPENLAARASALQRAAEAMVLPDQPPFGIHSEWLHAAAVDEVRRAKAALLKRAEKLWAKAGERHLKRTPTPD